MEIATEETGSQVEWILGYGEEKKKKTKVRNEKKIRKDMRGIKRTISWENGLQKEKGGGKWSGGR